MGQQSNGFSSELMWCESITEAVYWPWFVKTAEAQTDADH